jgi:hypothetical protein
VNIITQFVVDKLLDVIFLSKSSNFPRFMFGYPSFKVVRHAGVEHFVGEVGHDIDSEEHEGIITARSFGCASG